MISRSEDILIYLIENKDKAINIYQLSKALGLDYKNAHRMIKKLEEEYVVILEKFGNATKCTISNKMNPYLFSAEFRRREQILKNRDIKTMLRTIDESTGSIHYTLLLFGSYAKKTQHRNSDIDLMFIIPAKAAEKKIDEAISIIPLPIHPVILTESEFRDMYGRKTGNVVNEAVNDNIILRGIENYYKLIQ
ncbi:MAG: nucleotidyltransferase domain-containing protein [archaeon]|nr:nucleotidyltransferase domain-containing protein [archaeon]